MKMVLNQRELTKAFFGPPGLLLEPIANFAC